MIGQLSQIEIEELLHKQIVGRIGCHDKNLVYIVPMSYAYDGENIYCHTYNGKKLEMMRKNPKVCFQVDEMNNMADWKSVLAWGEFEELNDQKERNTGLRILLKRSLPIISSITTHLGEAWPFSVDDPNGLDNIPGVVFRIFLKEKTGRFERTSESPMLAFN
jgi:nitroimidazol reductase NimA-like FMN-containing flavoprotein (pyridoxamine 5'-phosphate oxidase superfamily)